MASVLLDLALVIRFDGILTEAAGAEPQRQGLQSCASSEGDTSF